VYVAPEQWSFPLRLPSAFFGIFRATSMQPGERYPWSDEFDHRILTINISKGGWQASRWSFLHVRQLTRAPRKTEASAFWVAPGWIDLHRQAKHPADDSETQRDCT